VILPASSEGWAGLTARSREGKMIAEAVLAAAVCGGVGQPKCVDLVVAQENRLKPRLLVYGGLGAADLITTELALRNSGAREGNPLLGNRAARVGLELGLMLGSAKLDQVAGRKKTGPLVWVIRGVRLAGTGLILRENLRVAKGGR
jgi:hypothetical protein